jgi:hypothetical protein
MPKTNAQKCRDYRARKRQPRPAKTCHVCGQEFTPARAGAVYCGATRRSKARHDRQVLAAELAAEHGLSPVAAKVIELAIGDRGLAHGFLRVEPAGRRGLSVADRLRRLMLEWLIKLVHERHRYGPFPVSGWSEFEAMGRWLDANPGADLVGAERELRRLYKALFGVTYRLPQRADGVQYFLPPMSEHALKVMATPMRRSAIHRDRQAGRRSGDCVMVAVATALRIDYAAAAELCGTRGSLSVRDLVPRLEAAGYRVQREHVTERKIPLRRAGEHWPEGRHIAVIKGHMAALVDGHVDDHAGDEKAVVQIVLTIEG